MNTIESLRRNMNSSLLCVGLDPDLSKIPLFIKGTPQERIHKFLTVIVSRTAKYACAYKAQKAFFDILPGGQELLQDLIGFIHNEYPHLPVLIDCKIGDIDNTMIAYIGNIFGKLNGDGIVVNPYMGEDVIRPLQELTNKAILVLCKTSNPGGNIIQDVQLHSGYPLWEHILRLTVGDWNSAGNMIPVISSTANLNMSHVRCLIPDSTSILLAGVGAQGGSYKDLKDILNSKRSGVFVNSSRGILYPYERDDETWAHRVEESAKELQKILNGER